MLGVLSRKTSLIFIDQSFKILRTFWWLVTKFEADCLNWIIPSHNIENIAQLSNILLPKVRKMKKS